MKKNSNFTLIELLITIAVIAILAALLLPALHASRSKARSTGCKSNLKQIGISLMQYYDSSDAWFPAPCLYMRKLYETGLIQIAWKNPSEVGSPADCRNVKVLRCPVSSANRLQWGPSYSMSGMMMYPQGASSWPAILTEGRNLYPRIGVLKNISERMLVIDDYNLMDTTMSSNYGNVGYYAHGPGANPCPPWAAGSYYETSEGGAPGTPSKCGTANAGMLDGHVEERPYVFLTAPYGHTLYKMSQRFFNVTN